jgi:hypothetical protein
LTGTCASRGWVVRRASVIEGRGGATCMPPRPGRRSVSRCRRSNSPRLWQSCRGRQQPPMGESARLLPARPEGSGIRGQFKRNSAPYRHPPATAHAA